MVKLVKTNLQLYSDWSVSLPDQFKWKAKEKYKLTFVILHSNWTPQDTPYPLFLATCYRNYNIPWRKYKEIQKKNALTNFAWVILLQYFLLLHKLAEPPIVFSSYDFIIAINLCFLLKIFKLLTIIIIAIIYLACHFYLFYQKVGDR